LTLEVIRQYGFDVICRGNPAADRIGSDDPPQSDFLNDMMNRIMKNDQEFILIRQTSLANGEAPLGFSFT
jgi:hypothetical protein